VTTDSGVARKETWIALLGRRDTPTDGVEDYCVFLGRALEARGIDLKPVRVPWHERGWVGALRWLASESVAWRGKWVIVQYTALAWSRRGFPLFALAVLAILRRKGARLAVVYHEPTRQAGSRWIGRLRGLSQDFVIRRLYTGVENAIFADPLATIDWLHRDVGKAVFISIGANIPEPQPSADNSVTHAGGPQTVAVFCLSELPHREREVGDIAFAMRCAAADGKQLKLVLLGRGTAEACREIEEAFQGAPVQISNLGLQDAEEVTRILARSDAMLCVRGFLYPRRGSALAGIACGLPLVGYAGAAEGTQLMEAGLALVPYGDRPALGAALARVLDDRDWSHELRRKSLRAQQKYFSWNTIAAKFVEALGATRTRR
jgi:glycosyltransferase involved in cell wall biosynthesis